MLRLPLRDVSDNARKLLYSLLTTAGTSLNSEGGTGKDMFNLSTPYAMVIRPVDTSLLYFYSPRLTLHADSRTVMTWSRATKVFEGSELILMPERSLDGTKRAWMLDTAAAINAYYGL
jgi:hypothetical protein